MTSGGPATVCTAARPAAGKARARRSAWRTLRRNPIALAALAGFVLLVAAVILAPLITRSAKRPQLDHCWSRPAGLTLWTDDLGRDILSECCGRPRVAAGGCDAIVVAMTGGSYRVGVGLLWRVARYPHHAHRRCAAAFPSILLLLSIVAALGPNLGTAHRLGSPPSRPSRVWCGLGAAARNYEYVTAARVLGPAMCTSCSRRSCQHHGPLIVYAAVA